MIVVGIDPHMHSHTAVAVDAVTGVALAELTVKARTPGFERLVHWARELDEERGASPWRMAVTSPGTWSAT